MPSQCLYNSIIIPSPWRLVSEGNEEQAQRLHEQSGVNIIEAYSAEAQHHILTLEQWTKTENRQSHALLINGFEEIEVIRETLQGSRTQPGVIFIDFPAFSDGRGYSMARLLKREPWFTGDVGAIGDVLQDQVFFYWRCGVDAIVPRSDQDIQACKNALHSFTHAYQTAARQPDKESV